MHASLELAICVNRGIEIKPAEKRTPLYAPFDDLYFSTHVFYIKILYMGPF